MPIQPLPAHDRDRRVLIVSEEWRGDLAPLCEALERRGIEGVVQPARAMRPFGACYIRTIDPRLEDESAFARVASIGAIPALVVNSPASVRLAECPPLAMRALRDAGIPQSERLWCLDAHDVARAAEVLGAPAVFEGVVSHRRERARSPEDYLRAFDLALDGRPERGAFVESALPGAIGALSVLVVDRCCLLMREHRARMSSSLRQRATAVALEAVAAIGASVMVVDIDFDHRGTPRVVRMDAAVRLDRLSESAIESVVDAISVRVVRALPYARWPNRRAGESRIADVASHAAAIVQQK